MTVLTEEEETKLHIATRLGDTRLVREALREGYDPNAVGHCGWTPLHEAASTGNIEITHILLKARGNPNFQDTVQKCSPLHLAARNGKLQVVKLLLDNGAKFNLRNAERKTPIDVAENECKRFLESKRVENLMKLSRKNPQSPDVHHMYGRSRGSTQPNWQQRTNESFTQSVGSSWSSDSGESLTDMVTSTEQQNLGDIKIWFEYNINIHALKIAVWEVRNLRVPIGHNYSHLYVKCYLLPDKNKMTKRKTSLKKLGSLDSECRSSSSSSGCSTVSEESDCGNGAERSFARRMRASLTKRPHLHKKKNKDKVKCMVQHQDGDKYGRISTPIQEAFVYEAAILSKVDMDTATVQLTVCGRSRRTGQGVPIASLSLPLSAGLEIVLAEHFPLEYKTDLEDASCMKQESLNVSTMSETKTDGDRRGSAWGQPVLSMSMPVVPTTTTAASAAANATSASTAIGRFKMFKKEMKLTKGRPNHRYRNQQTESATNSLSEQVQPTTHNDMGHHSRMDDRSHGQTQNARSRHSDLFTASSYRESKTVRQHEISPLSNSEERTPRPSRQLIYSRALMNDQKKASNTNDCTVEDFDLCDANLGTVPLSFGKSYVTNINNSTLAF